MDFAITLLGVEEPVVECINNKYCDTMEIFNGKSQQLLQNIKSISFKSDDENFEGSTFRGYYNLYSNNFGEVYGSFFLTQGVMTENTSTNAPDFSHASSFILHPAKLKSIYYDPDHSNTNNQNAGYLKMIIESEDEAVFKWHNSTIKLLSNI